MAFDRSGSGAEQARLRASPGTPPATKLDATHRLEQFRVSSLLRPLSSKAETRVVSTANWAPPHNGRLFEMLPPRGRHALLLFRAGWPGAVTSQSGGRTRGGPQRRQGDACKGKWRGPEAAVAASGGATAHRKQRPRAGVLARLAIAART